MNETETVTTGKGQTFIVKTEPEESSSASHNEQDIDDNNAEDSEHVQTLKSGNISQVYPTGIFSNLCPGDETGSNRGKDKTANDTDPPTLLVLSCDGERHESFWSLVANYQERRQSGFLEVPAVFRWSATKPQQCSQSESSDFTGQDGKGVKGFRDSTCVPVSSTYAPVSITCATASSTCAPPGSNSLVSDKMDRLYWCRHCLAAFLYYPNLTEHLQANHSSSVSNIMTNQPSPSLSVCRELSVTGNKNIPSGIENSSYEISGETFSQHHVDNLYMSLLSANPRRSRTEIRKDKDRIPCGRCPATFRDKFALSVHMRIHDGVKPFQCEQCSKRFTVKSSLTEHLKTVHRDPATSEEDKPKHFQCPGCPLAFTTRSKLRNHLKRHSGLGKKHQCPMCQASFYTPSSMRNHIRTHTGEKPFQCPHCPAAFAIQTNMKRHLQTHARKDSSETPDVHKTANDKMM